MNNLLKKYSEECLKRSISPMHVFHDGSFVPYGRYTENGEFRIGMDATSRYGYERRPIWGVFFPDPDGYRRYKIFIGEAPHKNENGVWITYNKVPSFNIGAFAGAHYLEEEPDIPHIITIESDEFDNWEREKYERLEKEELHNFYEVKEKIEYCTLKMYLHGLCNRFKKHFGEISKYTGEQWKYIRYNHFGKKLWTLSLMKKLDKTEKYFLLETEENLRFLYLKKDNKLCIKFEKQYNDHVNCSC